MNKLNKILFSLIAPVVLGTNAESGSFREGAVAERLRENAECGLRNAECLNEQTLSAVFALAKRHDLGHLLLNAECKMQNAESGSFREGAVAERLRENADCGLRNAELYAELERAQLTAVWRVKNILNEQGRVRKCLEKKGIPFILLKGAVTRGLYPEPWMRTSSDIDMLVPRDKLGEVVDALIDGLGCKLSTREPNDASLFTPAGVHFDVHTLIEGDEDGRLLTRVWAASRDNGGSERFMPPEIFYFHHVSHMAKHMRNGGCGIRPFIDLYLLNEKLGYDRATVDEMLTESGLARFEDAAVRLAKAWMSGHPASELAAMEEYVLTGGVYGSVEQNVASKQRGNKSRLHYLWQRVFMPYDELKKRHKALDGRPLLTPVFWVWRWLSLLDFKRFKRSAKELATTAKLDEENVKNVEALLDSLGI